MACWCGRSQRWVRSRRPSSAPQSLTFGLLELESEIKFHSSFTATTMLHPATYLNKVIVGSAEGSLQLWNVRTMCVAHSAKTRGV